MLAFIRALLLWLCWCFILLNFQQFLEKPCNLSPIFNSASLLLQEDYVIWRVIWFGISWNLWWCHITFSRLARHEVEFLSLAILTERGFPLSVFTEWLECPFGGCWREFFHLITLNSMAICLHIVLQTWEFLQIF